MTSGQTRIAVIGCGGWGKNIARTMARTGHLAAVVDPSESGRKAAAEVAPGVPVFASADVVFKDESIQGVMIATPAETHYSLARKSIEAGKQTFVEKPLTIDLDEARDLVERARAAGRVLMVGHLLEYHPAILKLRELIEGGELGKVRYIISNRLNLGKIRTEENALWSFAPHDIAVILRLVGSLPIQVVATGGTYVSPNIADVTVTQLLFDSGVRSHVFVSWLHPFKEQKLVIVGSKKMATFDDIAKEPLMAECEAFIEAVRTGKDPITDGASGVRVLEVLHAAQQSMMTNGQPTPVARGIVEPRVVVRRGVELAGSVGDIGSRP